MALIQCHECNHTVSDAAVSCPKCGVAVAGKGMSFDAGTPGTTIQRTSKDLKFLTLIGWAMMVLSVSYCSFVKDSDNGAGFTWFIVGFAWIVVMRVVIWWNHG